MSSAVIGALRVVFGADTAAFEKGVTQAERKTQAFQKRMTALGSKISGFGQSLTLGVTAPLAIFGKTAFDAAIQSREAFAQVESALKSMGGASGKTAAELQKSAKQLETFSNFDDDDILKKVTANLLTFGNVAGEQFDKAQQAAVDLSARLGQDLQSSTIMLGKALNDPIAGITAMTRVGVSFTEEQKNMIKAMAEAGDIAGAQGLILAELERQYGGAAKAAREAAPGGDQLQQWRTFQEIVGERLVVAFEKLEQIIAPILKSFNELDEDTQTVIVVVAALAAALGPLLIALGAIVTIGPAIVTGLGAIAAGFGILKVAMLGLLANPVLLGAAAVIAAIWYAWENWDKITGIVENVKNAVVSFWDEHLDPIFGWIIDGLKLVAGAWIEWHVQVLGAARDVGTGVGEWLGDKLGPVWENLKGKLADAGKGFIQLHLTAFQAIGNIMRDAWTFVQDIGARMYEVGVNIIQGLIRGIASAPGAVSKALNNVVSGAVKSVKDSLGIKSPSRVFMEIGGYVSEGMALGIESGKDRITSATVGLGDGFQVLADQSANVTDAVNDNFKGMADGVLNSINRLSSSIKSGGFLDILGSVIGLGLQLGGAGVFGKNVQTNIAGARAEGGPVSAGKTYLVGERGPELFTPGVSGGITANDNMKGGGQVVVINNSAFAEVFVDGKIQQAGPSIAEGGAQIANMRAARAQSRSVYNG